MSNAPPPAPLLPVMLRLEGQTCVVIGGGKVALRRIKSLLECKAQVTVIAPEAETEILQWAATGRLEWHKRPYQWGDLEGAFMAVLASSSPKVHDKAMDEAQMGNVLVNRTDAPQYGDIEVAAHERRGLLTVAIHTGGASAAAAKAIRDEVVEKLNPDWVAFLDALTIVREEVQRDVFPGLARENLLRQLGGEEGKAAFQNGGLESLRALVKN